MFRLDMVILVVVSMSYFNPEKALAAPSEIGGVPQGRALLAPPYAIAMISCSGLFAFIFLLITCLCCKRGDVGFKEFENPDGEEYSGEYSPAAEETSSSQSLPDVYILPLSEVSLPIPLPQVAKADFIKHQGFGRHNLSYLQEIGTGWFGKVILGEIFTDVNPAQVVVKELRVNASPLEQRKFLAEAQPYRSLQHPNILQCLGICTETIPFLLIMEFCQLGDLKRYLRAQCKADGLTPDLLTRDLSTLQRMAYEITSGVLHLHKNNYIHSDLALRNCLLTSDLTVRIGDYGLSHNNYKEDYCITPDHLWIPLRWIAPELLDEVHGNLVVVDQSKESNVWSLGVTMWELFEFGSQPYRHLTDEEVLTFVVKEQQMKLAKPRLKVTHSDYWYEVMQSCWLPIDQRPTVEEIHLLLTYLLSERANESEDSFERHWNALKPNKTPGSIHSEEISAFPLLDNFTGDSFHADMDDILTVTETSHGLNFEYMWEKARMSHSELPTHIKDYPLPCPVPSHGLTVPSNPFYDSSRHHSRQSLETPSVVPVISARSPSVCSEYYIRLEEHTDRDSCFEYTVCAPSPISERQMGFDSVNQRSLNKPSDFTYTHQPFCDRSPISPIKPLFCLNHEVPQSRNGYFSHDTRQRDTRSQVSLYQNASQLALHDMSLNYKAWTPSKTNPFVSKPKELPKAVNPFRHSIVSTLKEESFEHFEETSLMEPMRNNGSSEELKEMLNSAKHNSLYKKPEDRTRRRTCTILHEVSSEESNCSDVLKSSYVEQDRPTWIPERPLDEVYIRSSERSGKNTVHHPSCPLYETANLLDFKLCTCVTIKEDLKNNSGTQGLENCRQIPEAQKGTSENKPVEGQRSSPSQHFSNNIISTTLPNNSTSNTDGLILTKCGQFYDPLMGTAVKNYDIQDYSRRTQTKMNVPLNKSLTNNLSYFTSMSNSLSECSIIVPIEIPPLSTLAQTVDEDTIEISSDALEGYSTVQSALLSSNVSQQVKRGTLDSVDSLDIPSNTSSSDMCSPASHYSSPSQKFGDSGYETENTLSPELIFKDADDSKSHDLSLTPISESVSDLTLTEDGLDFQMTSEDNASLRALDIETPYRDSAYFSDFDTESEKCQAPTDSRSTEDLVLEENRALEDKGGEIQSNDEGHDNQNGEISSCKENKRIVVAASEEECTIHGDSTKVLNCNDEKEADSERENKNEFDDQSEKSNENGSKETDDAHEMFEKENFFTTDIKESIEEEEDTETSSRGREEKKPPTKMNKTQGETGFVVQVSKEELLFTLKENVTRNVLSSRKTSARGFHNNVLAEQAVVRTWAEEQLMKAISYPTHSKQSQSQEEMPENSIVLLEEGSRVNNTNNANNVSNRAESAVLGSETLNSDTGVSCNSKKDNEGPAATDDTIIKYDTEDSSEEADEEEEEDEDEFPKENIKQNLKRAHDDETALNGKELAHSVQSHSGTDKAQTKREGQPKLFLDFGLVSPQGSENIKAKVARLSLSLPPLNLQPFPTSPPWKPFWETDSFTADRDYNTGNHSDGFGDPFCHSLESEEEPEEVPIIVTETDDGRNLRSLLKSPKSVEELDSEELDKKRKMVSFFDDVTVYLFDQETPTNELSNQNTPESEPVSQDGPGDATIDAFLPADGFSGSFEWDDDFPLIPQHSSFTSQGSERISLPQPVIFTPALPVKKVETTSAEGLKYSRFTVSPALEPQFSPKPPSQTDMAASAEQRES
ncbi:uncharacterized protein LOC122808760 [Protopterus annectens]|uniref:uncharacterized protein LOC122808760 n=1 Tax=Protopterus annectens TaxID=7888 RepID=UPI001CF92FC9|nr:uncharacterized protein LOC122808760 [Protopterus annectens]